MRGEGAEGEETRLVLQDADIWKGHTHSTSSAHMQDTHAYIPAWIVL